MTDIERILTSFEDLIAEADRLHIDIEFSPLACGWVEGTRIEEDKATKKKKIVIY